MVLARDCGAAGQEAQGRGFGLASLGTTMPWESTRRGPDPHGSTDVDFLREALSVLLEGIMEAEVAARIGSEYGEHSPERVTQRNGYRSPSLGCPRGGNGVADSEAERRELLPEPTGATGLCWL